MVPQAGARVGDAPLSPRPGQAVAVARGAGVWKVWRDTGGRRTGGSRIRDGMRNDCHRGPIPERSGISPVGNPRMARVSNHADPRSSYRGSKSTPQVDFEPRELPAAGDAGNSTLPPVLCNTDRGAVDLASGYRTLGRPRVSGPRPWPGKPPGAGKCDVPGIFVTDPAEVWRLSDPIVTEVRLPHVPVTPLPRKPHVLGSSWGSQPARTPMRSPGHPAATSDGRPGPGPPPVPSPPPKSPQFAPNARGCTLSGE